MFDSAPRKVQIDGEEYKIIQEGVSGGRGRAENKVSEGRRLSDGVTVVLRHVADNIARQTLDQLNTSIEVRKELNGKLNPLQVPEFLCGERKPGDWCATTFIPGRTLHRDNSLPFSSSRFIPSSTRIETALSDTIGILETTSEWTKHGLIHRDLKPGNIVTTPEGKYGIIDWEFGTTSEYLDGEGPFEEMCGTSYYMAPEVATGKGWYPASDDFSIGVTIVNGLGLQLYKGPDKPKNIMEERANGKYRGQLMEELKRFEKIGQRRAPHNSSNPWDKEAWGRLRTWLDLVLRPEPTARPSRAEALNFLTTRGNITEV